MHWLIVIEWEEIFFQRIEFFYGQRIICSSLLARYAMFLKFADNVYAFGRTFRQHLPTNHVSRLVRLSGMWWIAAVNSALHRSKCVKTVCIVVFRAPVIPIMVIVALANLYIIVYAIWIVHRKKGSDVGIVWCVQWALSQTVYRSTIFPYQCYQAYVVARHNAASATTLFRAH